jgi:hypothetical protein
MSTEATEPDVYVSTTLTYSDASEIALRTVYLGLTPSIYIEPKIAESAVTFEITACDLDQSELANVLTLLGEQVAQQQPEEPA